MKTNIELAREARLAEFDDDDCEDGIRFQADISALARFAELVRADQRERDAQKADDIAKGLSVVISRVAEVIAAAIRAGGQE